jgi:tRNA (guanine-N7-)-methyltransferase
MRLKNIPHAKEYIEASTYLIIDPSKHKGNYNKVFNNDNPIKIEIGMGKGDFIINNALQYPEVNFIGIEKYDSVVYKVVQKLEDLDIPNLRLIRMDATSITEAFENEIDTVFLNFSDPWPKNRHEHRRLSSKLFLKRYLSIF